jgi:predicted nucleic acid-binding protein
MRPTASDAGSSVRVVDSSAWIEHFADGPLAARFTPFLSDSDKIITPTLVLYEVYRWARRHGGDREAMEIAGHLEHTRFVVADVSTAIAAAELSSDHGLAAADALIYATARLEGCELVTADTDFRGLPGVTLIEAEAST